MFCQSWCLSLNISKTTYTIFTTAGKRKSYEKIYSLDLKVNNNPIRLESAPKFLGIAFDPKLSFKLHFEKVENEMQKRLNMVKIHKSKFWSPTPDFLLNFYKSFIRPLCELSILSCK